MYPPRPRDWSDTLAWLFGKLPADSHAWIAGGEVPAFVRFEGSLTLDGPPWRIDVASPRWPQ